MDWHKDPRKDDYYTSDERMYELLFSSQQSKAKDFRKHCCNLLFPHVRQHLTNKMKEDHQQTITGIQKEHQLAIEEHEHEIAFLKDDLQEQDNRIQVIQYENIGLQGKIRAKDQHIATLQRRYVGYLSNEDNNNGITIIVKASEEAEYPYISICSQHGYSRHKAMVFLARNQGSTRFADGDTPNAIVTYNFWQEHRLIAGDPNRPRHFRLDVVNREQLLVLKDA